MISVEVHSNNVLTVRDEFFANAVSDSIKHETVKFLFSDNWDNYQKTAVFTADGVEPVCVVLDNENALCVSENECYIPFEVLESDGFNLSVFGIKGDSRATSTTVRIEVFESGYVQGEAPKEPTPDQYSQLIDAFENARQTAESVRKDAESGLFQGEKGEKGDKGDTGEKGADGVGRKTQLGGEVFNGCEDDAAAKNAHAEGNATRADGNASHSEGNQTKATGNLGSHAEGLLCNATADSAHAEGQNTTASGVASHSEGASTKAMADQAHAEGISTSAKGKYSHVEGYGSAAIGMASHSEGGQNSAWGKYSHAEGYTTNSNADYSHASGDHTRADFVGQAAVGRFNAKPIADSVFTVGNGTADNDRKNAFNVFLDGHAEVQTVGETENSVATKQYVDNELATFDFIKVVEMLPETGLPNKIYLVPSAVATQQNLFDEYIWVDNNWEYITSKQVEVDLTDYYKKDQVNGLLENIQIQMSNLIDVVYPVGCVYLTNDTEISPEDLFGGTWQRIKVIKTVSGRSSIANFTAGQNVSTSVGDISAYKFLSDNKTSFHVTPYSGAAGNISCSAGNITIQNGYLTGFDVITNRTDTNSFTVFWTITGKSDFDENGNYHWVRME